MRKGKDKMLDGVKKLKKNSYEKNMVQFREVNGHYFSEMMDYMEGEEDKEKAAEEIGKTFVDKVEAAYEKKGKVSGKVQTDLNFFMIYYTFPAILMTHSEYAKQVADSICGEWGMRFKDSKIGFADYDTIYSGFREKIFGIF